MAVRFITPVQSTESQARIMNSTVSVQSTVSTVTAQHLLTMKSTVVRFITMAQVHQSVISRVISQITVLHLQTTTHTAVRFITMAIITFHQSVISRVISQITVLHLQTATHTAVRFLTMQTVQTHLPQSVISQVISRKTK